MDYLYKKSKKVQAPCGSDTTKGRLENEVCIPKTEPATIITFEIPKPVKGSVEPEPFRESEPEVKQLGHITFISQEEYLRDIETMCQRDKWFMQTIKGFCDKVVDVHVEQPVQCEKSTSVAGKGSE